MKLFELINSSGILSKLLIIPKNTSWDLTGNNSELVDEEKRK